MKNQTTTSCIIVLFFLLLAFQIESKADNICSNTKAQNYTEFDESEIYSAFEEIDGLITYISVNPETSYTSLAENNPKLIENTSAIAAMALQYDETSRPPVIGAFLWGCLFGPIGILVVAITTDNDHDQLHKSGCGCAASYLIAPAIFIGITAIGGVMSY